MNKNLILFCDTCGEMKMISYKYSQDNLIITCQCLKEQKNRNYQIDLFLNNKYKSSPLLKCKEHNSSFSYWCENCKINFCDNCLSKHNNHKNIKLSSLLINSDDINNLEKKVKDFGEKLEQKKKIVQEKQIFNQKEENEFFVNFNKYYNLNINEIAFVKFIKDQYNYLLKNQFICYQIIMNLKYLIEKLINSSVNETLGDTNKKDEEINDFLDIYNIVFKFQHFCLLPNNDNEEIEKKAEETQTNINLERSNVINLDELSDIQREIDFNQYLADIPMTQSIQLINDKSENLNINEIINNNNNNINNSQKEQNDNKSLFFCQKISISFI